MLHHQVKKISLAVLEAPRERRRWPAALLLSAYAGGAIAQQVVEENSHGSHGPQLESVVVTSQKREESIQDIPTTLSVLTGDKLINEGIGTSAQEVLNYIPNASAFGSNHGKPRWWIRGIGTGNPQPDATSPVGVYHDDVYIANSEYTGTPIFDLERVEVLSGPQGTLWGKNTTGGAINIISKQPRFENDGYLKLGYGTDDFKLAEGAVGGGLIDEKLAGRLSFHQDKIGPRFDNITSGGKEGTVQDRVVRGQLLAALTDTLNATLNLHHRKYETDGRSPSGSYRNPGTVYYWPVIRRNPDPTNIEGADGTSTNQNTLEQNGVNLRVSWDVQGYDLTSITAYDRFRNYVIASPADLSANATDNHNKEYQVSQEIRLTSPREERFNWIAGFHYFKNEYERQLFTATFAGLPLPTGLNSASNRLVDQGYSFGSESYAVFVSTTYNFTDDFYLTTGLRFTNENKTVDAYKTTWGAGTTFANQIDWLDTVRRGTVLSGATNTFTEADANHDKTWTAVTYDITPTWEIDATKRVYLRYARGIKAGGFNTNISRADQLRVLDPETLDSLEAGFKSELFDQRLFLNASLFGYSYKDAQVNVSGPYGGPDVSNPGYNLNLSVLQNVPKGKGYGAEVTVQALPIENLSINANLGLLRTQFDTFTVQDTNTVLNDPEFVRSPHVTALFQADYRIPLADGNAVIVSGDWRYQARQFFYVNNQDNPLLQQNAYSLFNFRLAYETEGAKDLFTLALNNAFDKEYFVHGSVVTQSPSVNGWNRTQGSERNWQFSYTRRW